MIKEWIRGIITLIRAIFEPDSPEEQEKDKEIQWERDQWGYPKQ
jgi:hypothetical protein